MIRDPHHPRYVISVAAELTGVHPQTLRAYERVGLVRPARTPGGGRRYSDAEVTRIARIAELTRMGLPHVGIKLVLELEDELRRLQGTAPHPASRTASRAAAHPAPLPPTQPTRAGTARMSRRINP
jgi:MerR family transcriptional regulator/heat shock protein HspR